VQLLNEYVGEFGTLSNRRHNGLCRQHHSMVAQAIKRSRQMAFMPYTGKLQLRKGGGGGER
jgi:ribosomal protein S18